MKIQNIYFHFFIDFPFIYLFVTLQILSGHSYYFTLLFMRLFDDYIGLLRWVFLMGSALHSLTPTPVVQEEKLDDLYSYISFQELLAEPWVVFNISLSINARFTSENHKHGMLSRLGRLTAS